MNSTCSVILVHSLIGGPEATWTVGSKCWPRDFLPVDFEDARVLSFGYSALLNPQTSLSAEALGQLLLRTLAVNRSAGSASGRPLVFIAHGIGGLIVKAVGKNCLPPLSYSSLLTISRHCSRQIPASSMAPRISCSRPQPCASSARQASSIATRRGSKPWNRRRT